MKMPPIFHPSKRSKTKRVYFFSFFPFRPLRQLDSFIMRTCLAPCEDNRRPTPARPACELISRAVRERRGLGCPLTNRKIPLQTRRTMHKEPPLDNPAPQCVTQKAPPPPVASAFVSGEVGRKKTDKKTTTASPPPNPHLSTSSIRGCARKTGRKTIEANAEEGGGGGR